MAADGVDGVLDPLHGLLLPLREHLDRARAEGLRPGLVFRDLGEPLRELLDLGHGT